MGDQPLEPLQPVGELRAGFRIAVGHIKAADQDTIYGGLDVTALRRIGVARQTAARLEGRSDPTEDSAPQPHRGTLATASPCYVTALLAMPPGQLATALASDPAKALPLVQAAAAMGLSAGKPRLEYLVSSESVSH